MKTNILRSMMLLSAGIAFTLTAAAQDVPKTKVSEDETKVKWEDAKVKQKEDELKVKADDGDKVKVKKDEVKIKDEQSDDKVKVKKDEVKIKTDDVKYKAKKDEIKYKSDDLKVKDEKGERKIKGFVEPMQPTMREEIAVKEGEQQVNTKTHVDYIEPATPEEKPAVAQPDAKAKVAPAKKKTTTRKYAARKTTTPKSNVVVRTKVVRDTVYVATPPQTVIKTEKEIVRDTVTITRVDTVERIQTENTYTGYNVPRGDFKKVKLKKTDDGDIWMKRKDNDGKTRTEKLTKD